MKTLRNIVMPVVGVLAVTAFLVLFATPDNLAQAAAAGGGARGGMGGGMGGGRGMGGGWGRSATPVDNTPRTIAPYFEPATDEPKAPDEDGFLQRWLLLEPITNGLNSNAGFNEEYIRRTFSAEYFPNQYEVTPKDGDKVTVNGNELTWHALDATAFNAKLFRFAYGMNKSYYGVTFFVYTVVDCPEAIPNVRLAVGSNSASMWWVNGEEGGEEAVALFGDRRMVMDDCVSKRLTLQKGKNTIRGVVINGPGMSDFCARFIDEDHKPVTNFTINVK